MIHIQNIHSLTDFQRNTSRHISSMRESGLPQVLTVQGKAELVVQSAEAYQEILDRLALLESARSINRGLQSVREGKSRKFSSFVKELEEELAQDIKAKD
ncbi:type II toxin-antitoxin system Phd/YefM family antitoxin [Phragmitibacter flavus]|uniref:Type II toxin-antitoxin system Phd/YefM family antitoxin n=1 Tax=Phragmitibacter flavus TaxID=2576071 RepID=A0A5R8KK45_9BACT|nr:type II toxin-antitoxin system Phd/YefM family antitoxin [Phragmitibacter flavus]TLD72611.1 type II toxin-antitoxin system Phd/YefM family antitoxin [Phragmitibacter flavus]